jgi:hypothetical protein
VSMRLSHLTKRDETLTHQVIFTITNHTVSISCNCRVIRDSTAKGSHPHPVPIGPSANIAESRRIYNDPTNHFTSFTKDDEAKW